MKYVVNSFFVCVISLFCEVISMEPEKLYSGQVGSEYARTYIYPCKNNGQHFIGAITVDAGRNEYLLSEDMLRQLTGLLTDPNVIDQPYPRVIWSGTFHFCRKSSFTLWSIDSEVDFYSVYNENTYLEPSNNPEERLSRRYNHGEIDYFVRRSSQYGDFVTLKDNRDRYLHSSNGEAAVYRINRFSGWRGAGSVTQIANNVDPNLGSLRVKALSMGEFLTGIGQSQGHSGHILNRGKRFAPFASVLNIERGENFVDSVLKEFRKAKYSGISNNVVRR